MNAAMSASLWLNETTPGSAMRITEIAAATASSPRAFATCASVWFLYGPSTISSLSAPPRLRMFSTMPARSPLGERGIVEALEQRRAAAVLRPERHQRRDQARAARRPGILVRGDFLPGAARRLDLAMICGACALHVDAQRLDVRDMRRQMPFAADPDRLVDRRGSPTV